MGPVTIHGSELFISYAQNLEDVLLWRALRHVGAGFYIDVGASSPIVDSTTLAFYERGWRGINVEPHPVAYAELATSRPRDVNLDVAVGEARGKATLTLAEHAALSTIDAAESGRLDANGMAVQGHPVDVTTLSAIWAQHVSAGQAVHFLKVDVEGSERHVLLGNDWSSNRPWIVLIEATRPQTAEPTHADWEPILLGADYRMAYFDGLNRYYVADEHAELVAAFDRPVNVFDRYMRASERDAHLRVAALEKEKTDLLASKSWRWTGPLRRVGDLMRRIRGTGRPRADA